MRTRTAVPWTLILLAPATACSDSTGPNGSGTNPPAEWDVSIDTLSNELSDIVQVYGEAELEISAVVGMRIGCIRRIDVPRDPLGYARIEDERRPFGDPPDIVMAFHPDSGGAGIAWDVNGRGDLAHVRGLDADAFVARAEAADSVVAGYTVEGSHREHVFDTRALGDALDELRVACGWEP